jgi:hypothetical protein
MPPANFIAGYSDGGCSMPLVSAQTTSCTTNQKYGYSGTTGASCDPAYGPNRYQLFQLTPFSGSTIYTGTPANCKAATPTAGNSYWSLGTEVDYSQFAEGNIVTE